MSSQHVHVDEREARRVAEAARERSGACPGSARSCFSAGSGSISSTPTRDPTRTTGAGGGRSSPGLSPSCATTSTPRQVERDAGCLGRGHRRLAGWAPWGLRSPGIRWARAVHRVLQPCARAGHHLGQAFALLRCCRAHQSIGVAEPLGVSAPRSRNGGTCRGGHARRSGAFLLTEADVGSDPARMRSQALPVRRQPADELSGANCGPPTV